MRIDLYLFKQGLAKSRTHAANLIKLHRVFLRGKVVEKPSYDLCEFDIPEVREEEHFFSLGGCKLKKAFTDFKIDVSNKVALDAGCANGGFTGVLLDGGAKVVFAVDVGENALPTEIKNNSDVVFLQKNVRFLSKNDFTYPIDFISSDLSFISLKQVLPVFFMLLSDGGEAVCLIKPQFEVGKAALGKSGIVTDKKIQTKIVNDISVFAEKLGFQVLGLAEAPHPFENKNQEFLLYLRR